MRDGSRKLSKDELQAKVTLRRQYISLDKIDTKENTSSTGLIGSSKGYFTVGVIVDKIGVLTSKGGKKFTIVKLSDLVKYNMARVKQHLERVHTGDAEGLKTALKAYNPDGYKTMSIMAFNESALPSKNIKSGTVVALCNPRMLPPSANADKSSQQGLTFCIDTIDAVI